MPLRNAQTLESTNLVFHDKVSGNPFLGGAEGGALENFYYDHGKLVRIPFAPPFQSSAASSEVWREVVFNFSRDGAPETQLLTFKANGKVYKRVAGSEQEIFPPPASINAISANTSGYAATGTFSAGGGSDWTNATNAQGAPDITYATATISASFPFTDYLQLTNFSLSPTLSPTGVTINIPVLYSGSDTILGVEAWLIHSGAAIGHNKTTTFTASGTITFGSETDNWGASLSNTILSDSTFGVQMRFYSIEGPEAGTFSVDSAQIVETGTSTATTGGFNTLSSKPAITQIRNRLMVSDEAQILFYDGWNWVAAGLVAPAGFDAATNIAVGGIDGTLTTSGVYSIAITSVHIRSNGGVSTRVHESNRSDLATATPGATQHITVDTDAVTFPARATHWSIYMSELDGSGVYRRVTTLPITTTTHNILAEPDSTAAIAPERNDPVRPSRVLASWKNRIAMRNETAKDQFWFTAFGEVNGLVNGAGEECLPGRDGSTTLSDLTNEWTIPDGTDIQSIIYHEDFLWVFTETSGYLIRGEGALLDSRSLRDFFPQKQFSFGASGPLATCSTPYGLIILSPEKKLWLWDGGAEVRDVGYDIQSRLDDISDADLFNIELMYWGGKGLDWLLLNLSDRIQVFDFSLRAEKTPGGAWFSIDNDLTPSAFCSYNAGGKVYLLVGYTDGSVHQVGDVCQPAHLGFTFRLGSTYFGSSVQSSPSAILRPGPIRNGEFNTWLYLLIHLTYVRPADDASSHPVTQPGGVTDWAITVLYDSPDVFNDASAFTSTTLSNPANNVHGINHTGGTGENRYWFKYSSGSGVGVTAFWPNITATLATTKTLTPDGTSRSVLYNNEVSKFVVVSAPRSPMSA